MFTELFFMSSDFNSKLADIGLGGSQGVRRSPRQHSQTKLSQSTPNRSTPKSSIYGLIKKKDEATPVSAFSFDLLGPVQFSPSVLLLLENQTCKLLLFYLSIYNLLLTL